jgi:hypothetical protein
MNVPVEFDTRALVASEDHSRASNIEEKYHLPPQAMPTISVIVVLHAKRRTQTAQVFSLDTVQNNLMEALRKEYGSLGFKSAMMLNWMGRMLFMQRLSLGRVSILQVFVYP